MRLLSILSDFASNSEGSKVVIEILQFDFSVTTTDGLHSVALKIFLLLFADVICAVSPSMRRPVDVKAHFDFLRS